MIVFRAYKFRLYQDELQKVLMHQTFGCTRYIYNFFLNQLRPT